MVDGWHFPPAQSPPPQANPHPPQFSLSVVTSRQAPPHAFAVPGHLPSHSPAGVHTAVPPVGTGHGAHAAPHARGSSGAAHVPFGQLRDGAAHDGPPPSLPLSVPDGDPSVPGSTLDTVKSPRMPVHPALTAKTKNEKNDREKDRRGERSAGDEAGELTA